MNRLEFDKDLVPYINRLLVAEPLSGPTLRSVRACGSADAWGEEGRVETIIKGTVASIEAVSMDDEGAREVCIRNVMTRHYYAISLEKFVTLFGALELNQFKQQVEAAIDLRYEEKAREGTSDDGYGPEFGAF